MRPPTAGLRVALILVIAAVALAPAAAAAAAEEPSPSLPVTEAAAFLGDWKLTVDFQGQKLEMAMSLLDEDGFVAATVFAPQGTQRITDITRSEDGLDLAFDSQVGAIHLTLRLAGDELLGKLATESGGFEASLRGVRGTLDIEQLAEGGLFGSPPAESSIDLADGEVSIRLPDEDAAMAELSLVRGEGSGRLLILPDSAAIKLRTDVDLLFGGSVVSGSLSDGYPGVYSLWILHNDDGWRLRVNREADVWGTQHQPDHDIADVPLDLHTGGEVLPGFSIELETTESGGLIRARWQENEWTASFSAAQP